MKNNIAFIIMIILLLISNTPALADVAPPEPPSGSDPVPGNETTNVRMVSETVFISIDADGPLDSGDGMVTATFTMRNLGDTDEQMNVRFPLDQTIGRSGSLCSEDVFLYPTISNLKVSVDGKATSTKITYQTVPMWTKEEPRPTTSIPCWANFPVTFPVGKDVILQVTYTAQPYDSEGYNYSYILTTGAGWKGTIGTADIIFEVPYELNETNFISCFPDDCSIDTTRVQWHFENFDPEFNIRVSLLPPPTWQRILIERENTTKNPSDGEAWGRLGKAYKESIRENRGFRSDEVGREIYKLSKDAYQKAVALLPNDADWHYGFADLLCWNAIWTDFPVTSDTEAWRVCAEQIQQVSNLNPNHEGMNELIEYLKDLPGFNDIIDLSGSQPDYLILTPKATITLTSTETPNQAAPTTTAMPSPTSQVAKTVAPIITSTSTSIPVQTSTELNIPVLIGGAILLFIAGLVIIRFRKA